MKRERKESIFMNELLMILMFLFVSVVYLLIISRTTSPLYEKSLAGGDSSIFMLLGKLTKEGMVPYKEFFDHKGPMIIFIEYIGYFVGGRRGVFLVQIIFFIASQYGSYKILRLFYSKRESIILNIFFLIFCTLFWEGGNLTEEYCLPFLMWSIYLAAKYFKDYYKENKNHNPWYSFVYGITFMMGGFTRITNALPICIMILVGFGLFIYQKKWKNIIENILMFILGCGIIFVPCIVYFAKNNALNEMIYATFIYNFRYAARNAQGRDLFDLLKAFVFCIPLITSFIIGIYGIICKGKEKILYICIVISSFSGILLQISGEQYAHYLIIWIPIFMLSVGVFRNVKKEKSKKYNILRVIVMICLIALLYKNVRVLGDCYMVYHEKGAEEYMEEANNIANLIPESERNLVIAYNVSACFYLVTDVTPCYKYCILQDWQCSKDNNMKKEFEEDILSLRAKYIVINNHRDNNLDSLISENYDSAGNTENLVLLKRK